MWPSAGGGHFTWAHDQVNRRRKIPNGRRNRPDVASAGPLPPRQSLAAAAAASASCTTCMHVRGHRQMWHWHMQQLQVRAGSLQDVSTGHMNTNALQHHTAQRRSGAHATCLVCSSATLAHQACSQRQARNHSLHSASAACDLQTKACTT